MATFLTQEYLDLEAELAPSATVAPTGSARIQHVVSAAPDGEIRYVSTLVGGRLTGQVLGEADDADATVTTTYPDAVRILQGDLDANAAFMSGRVKVAGSTGKLLAYLAATSGEGYDPVRRALAERTEV